MKHQHKQSLHFLQDSKRYNQRMQSIISKLEEMVDPFDLDVFAPYIQSNLSKLAQRSSVSRQENLS